MMSYFTVYQVTNLLNGMIYVGAHETTDLSDGYLGSGLRLNRARKKHGIENFRKEILKICESESEMYAEEAKIVSLEFVARKDTYNLACGGNGGWKAINLSRSPEELSRIAKLGGHAGGLKVAEKIKVNPTYAERKPGRKFWEVRS